MKNVEHPTEVKMLRNVCELWDGAGVSELEKRAIHEAINPINLSWRWDDKSYSIPRKILLTNQELEVKLAGFVEDTKRNPKLFRAFHLNYPQFLQDKFLPLISDYPASFLSINLGYTPLVPHEVMLLNAYLDKMAPHLFGLEFYSYEAYEADKLDKSLSPGTKGRFPSLKKLILEGVKSTLLLKQIWEMNNLQAPNCTSLLIEVGNRDLVDLLGPIANWCHLTHLNICGSKAYNDLPTLLERTFWILSLAKAGMTLKYFSMQFYFHFDDGDELAGEDVANVINFPETFAQICVNLTAFFASQANSLEDLSIMFDILLPEEIVSGVAADSLKITLPVFTSLRRLEIYNSCMINMNGEQIAHPMIFHSYSTNFPGLEDLTILGNWWDINWGGKIGKEPLSLKRLKVSDGIFSAGLRKLTTVEFDKAHLMREVCAVERLEVGWEGKAWADDFFFRDGEELPWISSLKVLHVYGINKPLKLGHLKKLKQIVIEHKGIELLDTGFRNRLMRKLFPSKSNTIDAENDYKIFLNNFIHIAKLDLDLIKFRGFKMSQEIRQEFVKYFPFRVEFIEKPIPSWNRFGKKAYQ